MIYKNEEVVEEIIELSLDLKYFVEAMKDLGYKIQAIYVNRARQTYHMRAQKDSDSFAFMVFARSHNILFPLNSRLTMIVTTNKLTTYKWLNEYNIPTIPTQRIDKSTIKEQVKSQDGKKFVLKTVTGQGGAEVQTDLDSVEQAEKFIQRYTDDTIIMQPEITGQDYRLIFLKGKLVAAVLRHPAVVVGDGIRTISELVSAKDDIFVAQGRGRVLSDKVIPECDSGTLSKIIPSGETYRLTSRANFSLGGETTDVTSKVPEETIACIVPMLKDLGADLIGVDILSKDIASPLAEEGYVIELNSTPGLLPVVFAKNQTSNNRQIYKTIIQSID